MKVTTSFLEGDHTYISLRKKKFFWPQWNNIKKMFYTCFTLVQVKNNYFKNKNSRLCSSPFPLLIFYDNLTKNFPGEERR